MMWRCGWPVLCWKFEEGNKEKWGDDASTRPFTVDTQFPFNFSDF